MNIKSFFSACALVLAGNMAFAQPATEFNVRGLKVIFKPSQKQTVSAVMFYKGGTSNYGADKQGIENLTLDATVECGTKQYNKDAFKNEADKYGIGFFGSSSYDYGSVSMSCVKPYFNQGWKLFAQAVAEPVFEAQELELLKQKVVANLKDMDGDPDNKLSRMAMENTFKGTRYAYRPDGTVKNVEAFTQPMVKDYYYKLLNVNRMVLVVVGNISQDELKKQVEQMVAMMPATATAAMPAGIKLPSPAKFQVSDNSLNVENRELATNYITGFLGAPQVSTSEYYAYRLAVDILSDKLFEEVRTKRNLSYAPQAYVSGGMQPYSAIYVTTTQPKEAVTVMVNEIKRLKNGGFTETDLRDAKSQFATAYFMKNESNNAIANSLGVAEIKGSWKNDEKLLDNINSVTLPQMQQVFKTYATGIKWNYLGNEKQADKAAFEAKTN